MCLAVPARVNEITGDTAQVDFGGVRRRIGVALVPGVEIGDYVLVHAGFAIQIVDVEEARRTLELIREVYADLAGEQLAGDQPGA
jgi:hydrogenase expression/formation protein HypC